VASGGWLLLLLRELELLSEWVGRVLVVSRVSLPPNPPVPKSDATPAIAAFANRNVIVKHPTINGGCSRRYLDHSGTGGAFWTFR